MNKTGKLKVQVGFLLILHRNGNTIRLSKLTREFNVGVHTIVEFLHKKGFDIDSNPNTKVSAEAVQLLEKEFKVDLSIKKESEKISLKSHRVPKKKAFLLTTLTIMKMRKQKKNQLLKLHLKRLHLKRRKQK